MTSPYLLVTTINKIRYRESDEVSVLQKKTPKAIYKERFAVYQDTCPSFAVVRHWCKQFNCGRVSAQRTLTECGGPSKSNNNGIINEIKDLILGNLRVTTNKIGVITGISQVLKESKQKCVT